MITAVYDSNCVICNTTRAIVRALDWFGRVEFFDLHEHELLAQRFPFLSYEQCMGEIHVIDGERVFAGFAGTRRMLRSLPLGIPLWALLRLPVIGDWLGPALYRFIARRRYAINRLLGVDLEKREADCIDGVCKLPE